MDKTVIFTDLDGTLLEHSTYRFEAALEMLEHIRWHRIPLIIVTSKTRPEVHELQKALGICEPFIVENGAGVFVPAPGKEVAKHWHALGDSKPYAEVRRFFAVLRERYALKGFGDMHQEEVMALTGLDSHSAARAMQRDFTEPFIADDGTDIEALRNECRRAGFDVVRGGRFFHLITMGHDKGAALKQLVAYYEKRYAQPVHAIALGDAQNDAPMFECADTAVLIPAENGSYAPVSVPGLVKAAFPGPKGWNETLKALLDVR